MSARFQVTFFRVTTAEKIQQSIEVHAYLSKLQSEVTKLIIRKTNILYR